MSSTALRRTRESRWRVSLGRTSCGICRRGLNAAFEARPDLVGPHGLWEGLSPTGEVVEEQVIANVASFILGLLGTGPDQTVRYLEDKGLDEALNDLYSKGQPLRVSSDAPSQFDFESGGMFFRAYTFDQNPQNVSGRTLHLTYQTNDQDINPVLLEMKPVGSQVAISKIEHLVLENTGAGASTLNVNLPVALAYENLTEFIFGFTTAEDRQNVEIVNFEFI